MPVYFLMFLIPKERATSTCSTFLYFNTVSKYLNSMLILVILRSCNLIASFCVLFYSIDPIRIRSSEFGIFSHVYGRACQGDVAWWGCFLLVSLITRSLIPLIALCSLQFSKSSFRFCYWRFCGSHRRWLCKHVLRLGLLAWHFIWVEGLGSLRLL